MATVSQSNSAAARRAQALREYWSAVRGPGGTALRNVAAFFLMFPPLAQGIYYLLRGLWPLLRGVPAETATESNTDVWLAQSGGVLLLVIGAALCLAAYRRQSSPEVLLLAFGSALGLTVLELIFIFQNRISAFYLIDVIFQVGLVAFWVSGWRKNPALAPVVPEPPAGAAQPVPTALPASDVPAVQ